MVLVTTESSVTNVFREYVGRVLFRRQLGRIVVGKFHVVQHGYSDFGLRLTQSGILLQQRGTQIDGDPGARRHGGV